MVRVEKAHPPLPQRVCVETEILRASVLSGGSSGGCWEDERILVNDFAIRLEDFDLEYEFRIRGKFPFSLIGNDSEWRTLSPSEVELLDRTHRRRIHRRGDTIFRQDNEPEGVYWIETGFILLYRIDVFENETGFGVVGAGEIMGHRSFFAEEVHAATARALTDCRVCLIPPATLHQLLDSNLALGRWFLRAIAGDRGPPNGLLLRGNHLPARMRLIHLLLLFKDRFAKTRSDGGLVYELPLKRREVASMLGVSAETIARTIRQLKDENIAVFDGRQVFVPRLDRLMSAREANLW